MRVDRSHAIFDYKLPRPLEPNKGKEVTDDITDEENNRRLNGFVHDHLLYLSYEPHFLVPSLVSICAFQGLRCVGM